MLLEQHPSYDYIPYLTYSEGYPDWSMADNLGKINTLHRTEGWDWVQTASDKHGYFWGGCIEVLEFMNGTAYWPDCSFFDDKVLLLETSEEAPSPRYVMRVLRNYGMQTILEKIQGLVIGRPRGYSNEQKLELRTYVQQIVIDEFGRTDIPIILDFDVGHTDPQFVIPFGVKALISSTNERVTLVEPIFGE